MAQFVRLTEIMDMRMGEGAFNPIYIKASSISVMKISQFMGEDATLVMVQNDAIWVKETPDAIFALLGYERISDETLS